MNRSLLMGAAILTLVLAVGMPNSADAFRAGRRGEPRAAGGTEDGAARAGKAGGEASGWHAEGGAVGVGGGAAGVEGGAVGVEGSASYGGTVGVGVGGGGATSVGGAALIDTAGAWNAGAGKGEAGNLHLNGGNREAGSAGRFGGHHFK